MRQVSLDSFANDDALTPSRVLRVLRRRRWVILQCLVVATAVGVAFGLSSTPSYSADASLLITPGGSAGSSFTVQTAAGLLDSRAVAQRAARTLGNGQSAGGLLGHIATQANADSGFLIVTATATTPAQAARVANAFADQFLGELRVLRATTPLHSARAKIIDAAVAPARQAHRLRVVLEGVIGGALGLLIGLVLSFALEALDPRLRAVEELGYLVAAPRLLALPRSMLRTGRRRKPPILSRGREPFDQLRTALLTFHRERSMKRLIVTSAHDRQDGKTVVAASLAVSLARLGLRVCLVDADLREPAIAREFGLPARAPGLAELLAGRDPEAAVDRLSEVIQRFAVPGVTASGANGQQSPPPAQLSVITAGAARGDACELLGDDRLEDLLRQLEQDHDVVVLDCPPVLAASDGLPLLKRASGTILVVRQAHTRRRAVIRASQVIMEAGSSVLGLVVTGVPKADIAAEGNGPWPYSAGMVAASRG